MDFRLWLENTQQKFEELAHLQRGEPEEAMLKVQFANEGGVLNFIVEHVGDLIHRMTERNTFEYAGYQYVKDKVEKTLRTLTYDYGFEKEMEENIQNNARYLKVPEEQFRQKVYRALDNYAKAHSKLPVYNEAQRNARDAAISVGERRFRDAIRHLRELERHLGSVQEWVAYAHEGLEE
jgi:hypothetical protein